MASLAVPLAWHDMCAAHSTHSSILAESMCDGTFTMPGAHACVLQTVMKSCLSSLACAMVPACVGVHNTRHTGADAYR